ncbi:hypothetical protein HJC23_007994 [Cyclotella cryptica]|uniref:Uncharacterized protein n=1 Tax=Cyclotella cryptica TaxID=29204 RepID=A0ABD3P7U8_9STRA|eukprot:CCRYP_016950-RA/>CCRYP_016950-RA protein AED:0.17 eAED:0.17 QI:0/-1/0/1/-1/1/1/0/204
MTPTLPAAFLKVLSAPHTRCVSLAANVQSPQMPHDVHFMPSLSSSSQFIGLETTRTFEAVVPDQSLLFSMGSVLLLCVAAAVVWANEVVPVSRTKLAISKSRGEVRDYLDGLRKNDALNGTEDGAMEVPDQSAVMKEDGRGFERWLFSDWLNKPVSKGGRQKEPALPILKDAKWNSGDNPVLVTAGIMMIGIILASITERVSLL